ncbi:MAG: hypothetical protein ACM3VT_21805 [Solirubrobacterales bacterium]
MKRMVSGLSTVLVILAVILLVLGLLLFNALSHVRSFALDSRQMAQLHAVDAAVGLFKNQVGFNPPSDANDATGKPYCGAMKLAEALMGRDLRGFHPESAFRCDGLDPNTLTPLYPANPPQDNVNARLGPYLQMEYAHAWRLADVFGKGNTGPFPEDAYVLCDTFERERPGGKKTGMPILYYRADPSGKAHQAGDPNNIYDDSDNRALIALGVPGKPRKTHPLIDPKRFYLNTQDVRVTSSPQPYRAGSFILISAGWDGRYGTGDDICNFAWKYREE